MKVFKLKHMKAPSAKDSNQIRKKAASRYDQGSHEDSFDGMSSGKEEIKENPDSHPLLSKTTSKPKIIKCRPSMPHIETAREQTSKVQLSSR